MIRSKGLTDPKQSPVKLASKYSIASCKRLFDTLSEAGRPFPSGVNDKGKPVTMVAML